MFAMTRRAQPVARAGRARVVGTLAITTLAALVCAPAAFAGVGFGVTPTFPSNVTVGQTGIRGGLQILNASTPPENVGNVAITTITLVPSCSTTVPAGTDCPAANADPGVFAISPTATGEAGTACAGLTFTVTIIDPATGQVSLVPSAPVVLTPPGTPNSVCRIDFTFAVLKAPTKPAAASGPNTVATDQIGAATGTAAVDGVTGTASGSSLVVVARAAPSIVTTASAPITLGAGTISDSAVLSGGVGATGSITFTAYGPNDPTCVRSPAFPASVIPVNGNGTYTSAAFAPTAPGTYSFVAAYGGDANNAAATSPCGAANESVTVGRPIPTISVTKTPTPGSLPAPGGNFSFTVVVTNTSIEALTLTSLTDSIYGNLNGKGTCATGATLAANGGTYTCTFTGSFTGVAGASQTDTVTPVGTDVFGQTATATANATVTLTPIPSISVTKTPTPGSLPAPGGNFSFTVVVTNTSVEALTLTSLTDSIYGNLNGKGSCATGATLAANGGTYTCTFTGNFTGVAGASQTDTVTPIGTDFLGQTATATANATVTLTPPGTPVTPAPSISVTKTPSPASLPAPGGSFSFTVVVTNTSTEALTLNTLTDNVYGNLSGRGTCVAGATLAANGGTYTCTFSGSFSGSAGASQTDTVTPVASDSGGRTATATAKATVTLTPGAPVFSPTRLSGPGTCVQGSFKTSVTGSGIKRVTFSLNGRTAGVKTKRDSSGRFSITLRPSGGAVQRVSAKIEYTSKKFGTTRTITKTFRICTTPRFTG